MFSVKKFDQFYWLNKCEATDAAVPVIADYPSKMTCDLNDRFSDLKAIDFPSRITQLMLVEFTAVAMHYQELSEVQNDGLLELYSTYNRTMAWLCNETETKY